MFKWLHNLYASTFGYPCIVCGKYWTKRQVFRIGWPDVIPLYDDTGFVGVCCGVCRFDLAEGMKDDTD